MMKLVQTTEFTITSSSFRPIKSTQLDVGMLLLLIIMLVNEIQMLNFCLKWQILYIQGKIYDFGLHRQTDHL